MERTTRELLAESLAAAEEAAASDDDRVREAGEAHAREMRAALARDDHD